MGRKSIKILRRMKNILFSIAFVCIAFYAQAQKIVQNGQVRLQNSKYETGKTEYIGGVQIKFDGSVATTSDNAGKFNLVFLDKKRGDLIFMEQIRKEGYELVNKKAFEYNKISLSDSLGTDIILTKTGEIQKAQKRYYEISDTALRESYEKEIAALRTQLKEAKISQETFVKEMDTLQKHNISQRRSLDVLAEKFARVNFDDVSELYQEAFTLFKAGKIDETIKKLEGTDFLKE
jgi:ribosomal 50S subunit-associated protein YjgA (DUF615 family)